MITGSKNILVINLKYIGDTIWMYPFIRNLKLNLPEAKISAVINKGGEDLLRLMPEVSEVFTISRKDIKGVYGIFESLRFLKKIRGKKFDTVFVLSNSDRPTIIGYATGARTRIGFESDKRWRGLLLTKRFRWDAGKNPHLLEYNLQALTDAGLKVYDRELTINVPEDLIRKTAAQFSLSKAGHMKSVIVHPGARNRLRQWGAENFSKVINSIGDRYRIFLIGAANEEDIIEDILKRVKRRPDVVSTRLSLLEFTALCKLGDLFVGNDSAPIHIAAAAGAFVVGIYGPTLSKHCGPWTEKKALFDISTLPCRLCRQDRCTYKEEQACLKVISPDMVIDKILEVLK